jgi:hypothetical protein
MSEWLYNGKTYDPTEEELNELVGFVYIITEVENGMMYIGKKLFWKTKILPITKKRKRRRRTVVQSDWRDYFSSNKTIVEEVSTKSGDAYRREILHLCMSKGECSYKEAREQFDREVLLRDDYRNGIINCRINAKHLNKMRGI